MSRSDFWSRRRAAVEAEAKAEETAAVAAEAAETEAALAERSDEELLAELDLPQPEELESSEAVREFLNSALPQRLKTRALRRLWRLNPVLANLDGLLDYGEDYTDAANVVENLQTAYQVGKGMLAHVEALAAKAEAEAEAASAPDLDEEPDGEDATAEALAAVSEDVEVDVEPDPIDLEEFEPILADAPTFEDEIPSLPASSRRMRFQFDHAT